MEDIEYVLEMATVVVLAGKNDGVLANYFYSGTGLLQSRVHDSKIKRDRCSQRVRLKVLI